MESKSSLLNNAIEGKNDIVSDSENFIITSNIQVIFTQTSFSGMVGETIESYQAYLIKLDSDNPVIVELTYEELKQIYGSMIHGRDNRISFWSWMNQMSPKMVAKRSSNQTAEAISIVK